MGRSAAGGARIESRSSLPLVPGPSCGTTLPPEGWEERRERRSSAQTGRRVRTEVDTFPAKLEDCWERGGHGEASEALSEVAESQKRGRHPSERAKRFFAFPRAAPQHHALIW